MSAYIKLPSGRKARRTKDGRHAIAIQGDYKIIITLIDGRVTAIKIRG